MYGLTFIQCCVVYLQPWIAGDEAGAPTTSSTTLWTGGVGLLLPGVRGAGVRPLL